MSNYKPLLFTASLVGGLLLAYSCHKPANTAEPDTAADQSKTLIAQPPFSKTIGAPMLRTTANVWKQRYQRTYKLPSASYRQQAAYLKRLLEQTPEVVGLAFYWVHTTSGLDFVPIPITAQGQLVKTATLTSARGQVWSWAETKQLRDRYSGPTKAYIFGANTFTRLTEEGAVTILMEPAINDNGEEVIVLSNAATPDSEYEYDQGLRCPPACPKEDIIQP